jgi:hypothetical protein
MIGFARGSSILFDNFLEKSGLEDAWGNQVYSIPQPKPNLI